MTSYTRRGDIATEPVTIHVTTTSTDSATIQVEWSIDEGDSWTLFNLASPHTWEQQGEHTIWFRIIGQSTIYKRFIHIRPQPFSLFTANPIIYVSENGDDNNSGATWVDAVKSVQVALDKASAGNQIWIAAGTYAPTKRANGSDPRTAYFRMKNGVAIYGGFAGDEETLAQRDFQNNKTILSGVLPSGGNAYHVFYHPDNLHLNETAILDGVIITAGNPNHATQNQHMHGGGMYNSGNSPTLRNVVFTANIAYRYGGGIYNYESNPALINVTFIENRAYSGGGMYNESSNPQLTDVMFNNNRVSMDGGGLYNNNSNPILIRTAFTANNATNNGGGVYNTGNSNATLTDALFKQNKAAVEGGGMYNSSSNPTLTDVVFEQNTTDWSGGGMNNSNSSPALTNVTFSGNQAFYGGGIYNIGSSPTLIDVKFNENTAYQQGGGIYNKNASNPTLTDVVFEENKATWYGGGMSNHGSSPVLTDVIFNMNQTTLGGGMYNDNSNPTLTGVNFNENRATEKSNSGGIGAGMYNSASSPSLTDVIFSENIADNGGGGIYNGGGSEPTITNVSFTANEAGTGGGMYNAANTRPTLINALFTFNLTKNSFAGSAIYSFDTTNINLMNATIYANGPAAIHGGAAHSQIVNSIIIGNANTGALTNFGGKVVNSLVDVLAGSGIHKGQLFDASGDPISLATYMPEDVFVHPAGANLHLKIGSPAIDVGDSNAHTVATDLAGKKRVQGAAIDLGVYEMQPYYTVSYDANDATEGTVPIDSGAYEENMSVTVLDNTGHLKKAGHTFTGWNTQADGKGIAYAVNTTFQMGAGNITLYAQWTTNPTYRVSYDANGATGGIVPQDLGEYEENTLVTVQENSGNLVKAGHTFIGWNTQADGKGTAYAVNTTFQMGAGNITLYAQWTTNPTYRVSYDANGATGGIVPQDLGEYEENILVTVQENSGNLVKAGHTFIGWNTQADGKGTAYAVNTTFQMGAGNVTLYAQWTANLTYRVSYDANGATGGTVPQDLGEYEENTLVTVQENSGNLVKAGYTFIGWDTQADGKGTAYAVNTTFQMGAEDVTLYAQWTANPTYRVSYDANGATGGIVPQDLGEYVENTLVTVQGNSGNLVKAGYTFIGWNTQADGKGTAYAVNTTFQIGAEDVTLYAQWTANPTYRVSYDANGATGGIVPQDLGEYEENTLVTVQGNSGNLVKAGYTFIGWNTQADGKGTAYAVNTTFQMGAEDVTLYAQWTANPTYRVSYDANGATGGIVPQDMGEYEENTLVTVQGNSGNLVKAGYTFTGWNTQADGKGTAYAVNTTFRMKAGNVRLYAQWKSNTLNEEKNPSNPPASGGGSSSNPPLDRDSNIAIPIKIFFETSGGELLEAIEINHNTRIFDLPVPIKEGFMFEGWYTDKTLTERWVGDTLVTENLTLYAKWIELAKELPTEKTFKDIENHWAKEMIEALTAQGIIQGYEDGTFRPNESVSRMHVAALLTRAFSFEPVRLASDFTDVSPAHPYYDAIKVLQQARIVDGVNGAFLPTEKMTRAQLAKILVGVLGLTPEGTTSFIDVDSAHWSAGYIAVLEREGIALGDNGEFRPNESVTRAQFVAFLSRIYTASKDVVLLDDESFE
ncbi:InlB B-repeat-containing protein [Metasolibacillus fluoroglycofenilyticus]|uniref:InlB B-repeat-containing protein n=1 Tax=Metasolibacillus fluoroglycofenilyticus TaxID=1239396 RepID=UPI000D3427E0|nr:InlB B-repeat-containing protein [Metasolibacillus fluoroglycofenilyticus]